MSQHEKYEVGSEPIEGFRLTRKLGQGSFGTVWQAAAPGGTDVAIKILSLSGLRGIKEFQALKLVKRIRHPNLVPLIAYWIKDEQGRLIDDSQADVDKLKKMAAPTSSLQATIDLPQDNDTRPAELIVAMGLGDFDLAHRMQVCKQQGHQGIPVDELLSLMEDSAKAIDFLNSPRHDMGQGPVGIQHCDIKPLNIMVVGGSAQVCDFGLARIVGDIRKTSSSAGTIAYVAPECLTDNEPSSTSDQYSLAVSYYELRTGRLPYVSEEFNAVMSAVLRNQLQLDLLPTSERAVIARATSLEPQDRYPTTIEMVHALRSAVKEVSRQGVRETMLDGAQMTTPRLDQFVEDPDPSPLPPPELEPTGRSRRTGRWVALVAIAAMAVGGGYYATRPKASPKVLPTTTPTAPPSASPIASPSLTPTDSPTAAPKVEPTVSPQVVTSIPTPQPTPEKPPEKQPESEPERLFRESKFPEAIGLLDLALAAEPTNSDNLLLRGTCYLELKSYDRAIADFTRILERDPRHVRALSRRGAAYLAEGKFTESEQDLTRALVIQESPEDLHNRGIARAQLNQSTAAIDDFTAALRFAPDNADELYEIRSLLADAAGDALNSNRDRQIHDLLIAHKSAETEQAFWRGLSSSLGIPPDQPAALVDRAYKVSQLLNEDTGNKHPIVLDLIAWLCAKQGDWESAVRWEQKGLDLARGDTQQAEFRARLEDYRQQRFPKRWSTPAVP